jgi:transposase
MCELLVGLPDTRVLGVEQDVDSRLTICIETVPKPVGCPTCGVQAVPKERKAVTLVDMTCFDRTTVIIWQKRRWQCCDVDCPEKTWTESHPGISAPRKTMTDRVGRSMTEAVGRFARTVSEVADNVGCDWHTVNSAVMAYGGALVDEEGRFGDVEALGLDETLFRRTGRFRRQEYSTQIVDVDRTQILDIVPGRGAAKPSEWIKGQPEEWKANIKIGTLDLSGTYKSVFDETLPHVAQIADPFHVIKHANSKLDECRRRVQNETLGHRGRKDDPLYRCRRLLTKAHERLDDKGHAKLLGLLGAGDPNGDVAEAWYAKEAVRELYTITDPDIATEWIDELIEIMKDKAFPIEVRSLGRTLKRWRTHILAWHSHKRTNGPTEAANNLVKRVKRGAFGFRSFENYRVRSLLYAGRPRWELLATVNPY